MIFKIFISSRNNDVLTINKAKTALNMTDIRLYIQKELKGIRFLDRDFFDIRINEDFGADASENSYQACLSEVKNSDFFIALYNGVSGWAPPGYDIGICHAELVEALKMSSKKTAYINVSGYFPPEPKDDDERARNAIFTKYVSGMNPFDNPLKPARKTEEGVKKAILNKVKSVVYQHLENRIKLSNLYFNIEGNNQIALDWKKLKYADREHYIRELAENAIKRNPNFSVFITNVSVIPDNMSVPDARSSAGRPFLKDQELIAGPGAAGSKLGPIHFIAIYGKASEQQVKNIIGRPDISAIKDDFGIYVWDQSMHIQLVFLTDCRTPEAVQTKFLMFDTWAGASGEYANMLKRAEARHLIVTALNEAQKITNS